MSTITLISGANQGIGLAVAHQLAKEHGHHVIIGSRNADSGAKLASSILDAGYKASSVQLDLDSDASVTAAVKSITEQFGRLDVLVNNAGILLDGKDPNQTTRDLFTQTFSTNVIGTACLTEASLPLLRKSSLPRLVFVSSLMGSLALATDKSTMFYPIDYKAYDASKAAVDMLTLQYARVLDDKGAKVNAVCPGLVQTQLNGYMSAGTSTELGAQRIVELATLDESGPTATFSNREGSVPW